MTGSGIVKRCRGCGVRFEVPIGAGGSYHSRACYTNPARPNRKSIRVAAARAARSMDVASGVDPPLLREHRARPR
jgi:hypothetical protein